MNDNFSITISTISLVLSAISTAIAGLTAYFAFFGHPRLQMTRPTVLAFAFEGSSPKVFLRTCPYSTAEPGIMIENMFVRLFQNGSCHNFSFWGYGDGHLVRGSGLFAPRNGMSEYHHFMMHKSSPAIDFDPGMVTLEVIAHRVGKKKEQVLSRVKLNFSEEHAALLNKRTVGIMFHWHPDLGEYVAEVVPPPLALRRA